MISLHTSQVAHQAGAYSGFCSMKRFIRSISSPSNPTSCTHLHTRVERVTVRVKCLAQEHNTMPPARAGSNPTARSGVERTGREANANMTHL